jgi:hypothetical protein
MKPDGFLFLFVSSAPDAQKVSRETSTFFVQGRTTDEELTTNCH